MAKKVQAKAKQGVGAAKAKAGKLTGSRKMQIEGQAQKLAGKAQEAMADAKGKAKGLISKAKKATRR